MNLRGFLLDCVWIWNRLSSPPPSPASAGGDRGYDEDQEYEKANTCRTFTIGSSYHWRSEFRGLQLQVATIAMVPALHLLSPSPVVSLVTNEMLVVGGPGTIEEAPVARPCHSPSYRTPKSPAIKRGEFTTRCTLNSTQGRGDNHR